MKRLELLDYGRLVGALSVVAFHYLFNGIVRGDVTTLSLGRLAGAAKYGYLGVEFFFIISGYVIFNGASEKTPGEFAKSRATRLYPAFWAAVLVTSCVSFFWATPRMAVTLPQVLVNFTMVPGLLGARAVDGVYWTLMVELAFYAAVFILLLAGQGKHLGAIALSWPALMLACHLTGLRHIPFLDGYFPFFATGMVFALLRGKTLSPAARGWAQASLVACLFLAVNGAIERASMQAHIKGVVFSPLVIAAVICVQFAFFVVLNTQRGQSMRLPGSRLAGGLTYPIYLVHAHVGFMLLNRFGIETNKTVSYLLVAAVVFLIALALHEIVERRLADVWRSVFEHALGRPIDVIYAWTRRPLLSRR